MWKKRQRKVEKREKRVEMFDNFGIGTHSEGTRHLFKLISK
jgi:hypothetical protein